MKLSSKLTCKDVSRSFSCLTALPRRCLPEGSLQQHGDKQEVSGNATLAGKHQTGNNPNAWHRAPPRLTEKVSDEHRVPILYTQKNLSQHSKNNDYDWKALHSQIWYFNDSKEHIFPHFNSSEITCLIFNETRLLLLPKCSEFLLSSRFKRFVLSWYLHKLF